MNAEQSFAGQSVETARRALTTRLKSAAIDSAELDARMLLGSVLGLDLTGMIGSARRALTVSEAAQLEALASRRLKGEPIARILGHKEFWGLPLTLSAATLVPRPDTETVVELALEMLPAAPSSDFPLRIADVGTGSGAILLALLHERTDAIGVGTDINEAALRTARRNAADLRLAPRASFVACNYAAALAGPFDLVVSNPPYVRSAEIASLATEVRDHDPHCALDGGSDGLDAYRVLVPQGARLLAPGGALVVEVGRGQSREIEGLMTESGLTPATSPRSDLAGIPRAAAGRKMPL
jgi:release factor glutamine methyltransferase